MQSAHAQTRFPRRRTGRSSALSDEPVLLQGRRVLFDEEVALVPVPITKEVSRGPGRRTPRRAS